MTDPCGASTATASVFKDSGGNTITSISVTDGGSVTVTIEAPKNSFATSEGVSDRCGAMSAAVYTDNNGSDTNPTNNWAAITGPNFSTGAYTLTIDTTKDLTLIADEASVTKTLYIKTQLVDYTSQTQYSALTVVIGETTCDCSALLWTNPATTEVSVAVGATASPTFPLPTADTSNTATNNAFAKCYAGSGTCSTAGSFSSSDVVYDNNTPSGTTLPSWMTFTSTGTSTQTLSLAPADGTATGTHYVKVVFTSENGPNPNYTALKIVVSCVVTSITPPAAPTTNLSYNVYDASNNHHDFTSATYTQVPNCGYAVTNSWAWEGTDSSTALTTNGGALSIFTTKKALAGTYPVKLGNTITIANNGGSSSTFTPASDSDKVVFTITIVDPCTTATINSLSFTPSSISVQDKSTATTTFSAPTNSVMDTHSDPALLCGTTSYALYADTSDTALSTNWAVLSGPVNGVYTITIDTTVDLTLIGNESSVNLSIQVKSTLDSYTSRTAYTQLDITITEVGCDCSYLQWVNPSHLTPTVAVGTPYTGTVPAPTSDDSLKTTINDFEKCFLGSGCPDTGQFLANTGIKYDDKTTSGGTTLPSWITYTSSGTRTQSITISPPDGTVIGTHTLFATFSSTHGADPFYTAFVFTVTCEVTSFSLPSNPADVSYTLFTSSLEVDLTSLVYT